MVVYLLKSDASEWFNQITDFLNGSSLKYALTVNPNIYVSCIKQFWTTVAVKKVNDVIRLQALVDKKKVVVTEAKIREALRLDDAEGVECLPNEEVFAELARMGYEKPSTKLTFYKAFFSIQWKFLIHTILQCMSTKRTSWNEFSSSMASAVICLSSGDLSTHTTKYTSPALTHKVLANMRRVGKGFSRVEKPLFEGMLVAHEVGEGVADEVHDKGVLAVGIVANGDVSAANEEPSIPSPTPPTLPPQLSQDIPLTSQIAQALEITKLKQRVKKLERRNKGRMIAEMDQDADAVLEEAKEVVDDAKDGQDADVQVNADIQGRTTESQEKIYKIDLDHANKVLSMQEEESELAELQEVVDIVTTTKLITKVVTTASTTITTADIQVHAAKTAAVSATTAAPRRTKGVVIRDPEETTTTSAIIHTKAKSKGKGKWILIEEIIDWDEVINHVKKKAKEDPAVKMYQALKRKPQTEAQARKNMMIYLKNVAGFKMDYFKGMSYDDIRSIFKTKFNTNMAFIRKKKEQIDEEESIALKRINETPTEKAAKRLKEKHAKCLMLLVKDLVLSSQDDVAD
nr:hypothetical protein [Tanacetum cinerariifolium]